MLKVEGCLVCVQWKKSYYTIKNTLSKIVGWYIFLQFFHDQYIQILGNHSNTAKGISCSPLTARTVTKLAKSHLVKSNSTLYTRVLQGRPLPWTFMYCKKPQSELHRKICIGSSRYLLYPINSIYTVKQGEVQIRISPFETDLHLYHI